MSLYDKVMEKVFETLDPQTEEQRYRRRLVFLVIGVLVLFWLSGEITIFEDDTRAYRRRM